MTFPLPCLASTCASYEDCSGAAVEGSTDYILTASAMQAMQARTNDYENRICFKLVMQSAVGLNLYAEFYNGNGLFKLNQLSTTNFNG